MNVNYISRELQQVEDFSATMAREVQALKDLAKSIDEETVTKGLQRPSALKDIENFKIVDVTPLKDMAVKIKNFRSERGKITPPILTAHFEGILNTFKDDFFGKVSDAI